MSKKKKKIKENQILESKSILDNINIKYAYMAIGIIIFITLLIFYKPYVVDGLDPAGADKLGGIGKQHQVVEYRDKTGEEILWNPNVFVGIPQYFSAKNKAFNIDSIVKILNHTILDWRVTWFIIAAVGIFLLFNLLGFKWYISFIGVIAFLFWPHFQGLIEVGHNAKIYALCAMPLVLYGFINFTKKRNLFSIILFTLFFSLQFRTQHFQIIFYTLLLILAVGIHVIIEWIKEKEYKRLYTTIGVFILGLIATFLMSAQPLFVTKEYTPYSTRGGNAIELSENVQKTDVKKSSGVSFEYATRWSFSPKEMMTLISPRFFGGTSGETYNGSKYPHLKGKKVPGTYWGDMTFTQSSEYMGIIIVVLAIFGIWVFRKKGIVIAMTSLLIFSLLLSFGRHFPIIYKPMFFYLPYFSKFRAPVMTLVLISFIVIILAMYGLKGIVESFNEKKLRAFLYISGFFVLIGLIPLFFPNILSYSATGDARYANNPQVIEMFKNIRMEFMKTDTLRMLAFLSGLIIIVILFYMKKIKKDLLVIGIFILVSVDMIGVSYRFISTTQFFNTKNAERRYFAKTEFDKIIEKDKEYNRVLGLGQFFQSNDLAYRHQLIGGYSAIKPQLIQDIVDNNLYKSSDPKSPINWNIVNMLNGKYIVSPAKLDFPGLIVQSFNEQKKSILYKNENALPRAFFVEKVKQLSDEKSVVRFMNTASFKPESEALVSIKKHFDKIYDIERKVKIIDYKPNKIKLTVNEGEKSFLILSETYFPIGWTCSINGNNTDIYQVNHLLRGIEIGSEQSEIVFTFEPKSYKSANMISSFMTYTAWLTLLIILILKHKDKILTKINIKKE